MKRNILYFIILAALSYVVYYFVFRKGASTLNLNERTFSVSDTADIGKIFIADMNGDKIEVVRRGDGWILDNKFPARKGAVDVILSTLKALTVRYPVSDATMNTVIRDLATHSRKVEIYNKKGDKVQSMYIGQPPVDNIGNYALVEGSKTPFVVETPGFVGSLETRFILDETEMRGHIIISIPFPSLQEIRVQYLDKPDSSFAINVIRPDSFLVYNPDTKTSLPSSGIDKDKVFKLVDFLNRVNCEGYSDDLPAKDSIIKAGPYCIVTLIKRNKEQQEIKLFHKPVDRRTMLQSDPYGTPVAFDQDRFYGLVNGGKDFVVLQEYHFGKLLRNLNYFRK